MTTKTPATPLPWLQLNRSLVTSVPNGQRAEMVAECAKSVLDAAYIAHAANEYPRLFDENEKLRADRKKLVEALRNVLRNDKFKAIAETEAHALLRSLGED